MAIKQICHPIKKHTKKSRFKLGVKYKKLYQELQSDAKQLLSLVKSNKKSIHKQREVWKKISISWR